MIKKCIKIMVEGGSLSSVQAGEAMKEIMSGRATDAQIAAFLTALRTKGETVEEISSLTSVMKSFCNSIRPRVNGRLVDTCGTGGDRIKTFNISTASAFVVAGAGVHVAKHGNRSFTSKCGSADVLEALGVSLNVEPARVERIIEDVGIGFMYAPTFHQAMKHATVARRDIGIRTVFNILGPLSNPAGADSQLIGVYSSSLVKILADSLLRLGCEEAMIVHGLDGLDEISTVGRTLISWLKEGEVRALETSPKDFGVKRARPEEISGGTPEENAVDIFRILYGENLGDDAKKDIVLVNAAAGIIVAGKAECFCEGIDLARQSIESGGAYGRLKMLVKASGGDPSRLERMEEAYA